MCFSFSSNNNFILEICQSLIFFSTSLQCIHNQHSFQKNEPRCDARRLRAFSFGYYLLRVEVSLHNPSRRTPHSKASRYATMLRRPNRHSNVACHRTAETALLIFKFTIFTESMQEKSDTSLSLVSLYYAISLQR